MNATVTELTIPKDKLEDIRKILSSKVVWYITRDKLKAAAGLSPSAVCSGISSPLYQVRYSAEGAVRVEMYCSTHYIETYHKTKDSTNEELAAKYNCQIGVPPPTIREPWD